MKNTNNIAVQPKMVVTVMIIMFQLKIYIKFIT